MGQDTEHMTVLGAVQTTGPDLEREARGGEVTQGAGWASFGGWGDGTPQDTEEEVTSRAFQGDNQENLNGVPLVAKEVALGLGSFRKGPVDPQAWAPWSPLVWVVQNPQAKVAGAETLNTLGVRAAQ